LKDEGFKEAGVDRCTAAAAAADDDDDPIGAVERRVEVV